MAAPELAVAAKGLAALRSSPSAAWVSLLWDTSASHLAEGRLSHLPLLSMLVAAVAQLQAQGALRAARAAGKWGGAREAGGADGA